MQTQIPALANSPPVGACLLWAAPAVIVQVAELDRAFELFTDATEAHAAARATGDAAEVVRTGNGLRAAAVGADVAIARLTFRLSSELKRLARDATK